MNFTLRIWRQQSANASGKFVNYQIKDRNTGDVIS